MTAVRVLLVEDHTLVRAGLRMLVQSFEGIAVVGETDSGREVLQLVETLKPDIVLMDIALPGLNGLEAAARVMRERPETRVIILSMYANEEYVAQALSLGVAGYLIKGGDVTELEQALRRVARGETYLTPAISRQVIDQYRLRTGTPSDPLQTLTSRQREILQLIAEGRSTRIIAAALHVSPKTVEAHRAQIMERLGIHDVPGLVRFAIKTGLVPPL